MLGKVTGPVPDRPPAAATASMSRRQEVWSETSEKIRPPTVQGEMMKAGTRNPAPIGQAAAGGAGRGGQGDELLGELLGFGVGGTTWSKNPSFSS